MIVYLDARDLINLLQKLDPCTPQEFDEVLRAGKHSLALSLTSISEISVPLLHRDAKTNVMSLLGTLQKMQIRFLAEGRIAHLELQEALSAFSEGREVLEIDPFVGRFDDTFVVKGESPVAMLINLSLQEIVWRIWTTRPEVLTAQLTFADGLRKILQNDRSSSDQLNVKEHFSLALGKHLVHHGLRVPEAGVKPFARWVRANPGRCPSVQLGFYTYRVISRNLTYTLEDQDMADFSHLKCLPYVDLITLDRRTRTFTAQACTGHGMPFADRLCQNTADVLQRLTN